LKGPWGSTIQPIFSLKTLQLLFNTRIVIHLLYYTHIVMQSITTSCHKYGHIFILSSWMFFIQYIFSYVQILHCNILMLVVIYVLSRSLIYFVLKNTCLKFSDQISSNWWYTTAKGFHALQRKIVLLLITIYNEAMILPMMESSVFFPQLVVNLYQSNQDFALGP